MISLEKSNISIPKLDFMFRNAKVTIIANSDYHEIELEGDFGKLRSITENVPSPTNPKTSYLASLSAVAMLNTILGAIKIGT